MTVPRSQLIRKAVVTIGCKCFYCGNKATHADHIVPSSKGGAEKPENMVAACASCNCTKNDQRLDTELEKEALFHAFILAPLVNELADAMMFSINKQKPSGLKFKALTAS